MLQALLIDMLESSPKALGKLNGKAVRITADGERMLLWILRSEFGHTGTKYGCGEGFCAGYTVLVNYEAVRSCQTTLKDIKGTYLYFLR